MRSVDSNSSSYSEDTSDVEGENYYGDDKYISSLYVHKSILEWFENEIQTLHPINSIIVEEICHNAFDENINHVVSDRNSDHRMFDGIWKDSKYKLRWKSDRTYFLQVDDEYEGILKDIQHELNDDLSQYIVHSDKMDVSWITIEKIEVYEFPSDLNIEQLNQIDEAFLKCLSNAKGLQKVCPLYVADPLPWHYVDSDFIDVDGLVVDICAEEWKRNNLLSDFTVEELLPLELANKDFRVPEYNDYLDRYIQNLLNIKLAMSMMDNDEKFEYSLPTFDDSNLAGYFIYKFHRKFSTLYTSHSPYKVNFDYIAQILKIPRFNFVYDKMLSLSGDEPDPMTLITRYQGIETIIYQIHNYNHFTVELFYKLLLMPNQHQMFDFNFCDGFNFSVPDLNVVIPTTSKANTIQISLSNSKPEDEGKLSSFIRFLIKVFKGNFNVTELLIFNCYMEDYLAFENVHESFYKIEFNEINVKYADLLTLTRYLSNDILFEFTFCDNITDADILGMLQNSNLKPQNLSIRETHSCTPLIFYNLAEYLMESLNVLTVHMNEMPEIEEFKYLFDRNILEFHKENDMLNLRNSVNGQQIDLYYLLNTLPDDDECPFQYT